KGIYEDFYRRPKPLVMNSKTQKEFNESVNCHICSCELGDDRVRDHCHFTGEYRGAAHNKCNLMCKKPRILPVIFHNLQGYDAHLFIKQLAKIDGKLDCIPSTEEKYISFSKVIKKNISLLTRKGVYPYDYVSSLDKLSETCLPPKDEFYSKLNDEDISDEDYQHAIKLDPAHYYTSPGLAWDACLKTTGQHLQLLHDYDMLMMFERSIRGGITHISKRYAEANNKYMKNYNPEKKSTFIQYLDANNLYGWAMSQSLPTHGFKWMSN
ncbi:unnamed protein product, partial [Porites evermanni]